ncbi:hypothetical protein [Gelidibacter sp. F63206]|jgi:hypothetical protein|uniref:hypothetical protein n=1 Tax=Gelidibacter sp. F63206 TaxID=2926425 RepID=UPI001FF45686|nr:hypothetical protein [Gelidibacter sp. F63206]MCK0114655.1 hypothetical protein [Gelidibacter sp. F63206]
MINPEQLNDYSKKVYNYIVANHNVSVGDFSLHPSDFGKNYLLMERKAPNRNLNSDLFLSSEDNMLTIGFHNYHCHFDKMREQNFNEEIKTALEYFNKILNDELMVVSAGGTTNLLTKEEIEVLESGQKFEKRDPDCISYRIYSWSGNYDRTSENLS